MTLQIKTSTGWEGIQHHGRNVIINGRLGPHGSPWIINQRGFDGNWNGLAGFEYGYDRWFRRASPDGIEQRVEEANIIEGATYTFSWDGGGIGIIYSKTGSQLVAAESPITIPLITSSPTIIYYTFHVPNTATNIQLELGTVPTPFEVRPVGLELMLCQRYYEAGKESTRFISSGPIILVGQSNHIFYKVEKRVTPVVNIVYTQGAFSSTSLQDTKGVSIYGVPDQFGVTAFDWAANSEIT